MPTRLLDRWLLLAAYLILVFVSAWNAWNTERALDRIEEDVCATAEIVLWGTSTELTTLGAEVDREVFLEALQQIVPIIEAVDEQCGSTFLDEIDLDD